MTLDRAESCAGKIQPATSVSCLSQCQNIFGKRLKRWGSTGSWVRVHSLTKISLIILTIIISHSLHLVWLLYYWCLFMMNNLKEHWNINFKLFFLFSLCIKSIIVSNFLRRHIVANICFIFYWIANSGQIYL